MCRLREQGDRAGPAPVGRAPMGVPACTGLHLGPLCVWTPEGPSADLGVRVGSGVGAQAVSVGEFSAAHLFSVPAGLSPLLCIPCSFSPMFTHQSSPRNTHSPRTLKGSLCSNGSRLAPFTLKLRCLTVVCRVLWVEMQICTNRPVRGGAAGAYRQPLDGSGPT